MADFCHAAVVDPESGPAPVPDLLARRIAGSLAPLVEAALGARITAGAEAGFGRAGRTPVTLIQPSGALPEFHEALIRVVAAVPGRISTPAHTLAGYRPHVTHRGDKRVREGEVLILDRIALVDMATGGGHATRRILRLWSLPAA